ncbi:site-specific integrase [Streptomyces sp. IBSNAI002]|uniref:site-specific integrase n=1 Tax=Streptomyces sp. IBSNAI002 TaxID=3457500 RepID=UPI003FD646E0
MRELKDDCPRLKKREKGHGSWYYYVHLPDDAKGDRRRPRKGGHLTKEEAEKAAQKLWDEASDGVDVENKVTVADFLRTWIANRADLKDTMKEEYADDLERIFIPALGHRLLRELRTAHVQAVFADIWAQNEIKAANQVAADQARAVCTAAHSAWKDAPRPRPHELRAAWSAARAKLKDALAEPRRNTGPGRQLKLLNTLSGAMKHAVNTKVLSENPCEHVNLPKYEAPEPLVWTDARVARWRATGEVPGSVMVWTPEQTGEFLDRSTDHRLYPAWHMQVFRAPRRGESAGLRWTELDLEQATATISHTLVTNRKHEVRAETPKSRASNRTLTLDGSTLALHVALRDTQQMEKAQWQAKHREDPKKYDPYMDTGYVYVQIDGRPWHPDSMSQAFSRHIKRLGLPPIRLHDLRHCAASLSLAAGLSMKAIQALLGHASYSLTANTYTSLMPQFAQAEADATVAVVPRKNAPPSAPDPEGGDHLTEPSEGLAAPQLTLVPSPSDAAPAAA